MTPTPFAATDTSPSWDWHHAAILSLTPARQTSPASPAVGVRNLAGLAADVRRPADFSSTSEGR